MLFATWVLTACVQNIRRDFVPGVLSEEELGNKLYLHELGKVCVCVCVCVCVRTRTRALAAYPLLG